jgi:hypothetical protein
MSAAREARPVRVAIREIGLTAVSPLEARRLADALPVALERALAQLQSGAQGAAPRQQRAADRVAAEIARTVAERMGSAR